MKPAAEGSSAHLSPATARHRRARGRRVQDGQPRAGGSELLAQRGQLLEQARPCRAALGRADGRGERFTERRPGARDAVVEPQHPDPPSRKHVVHGRGIGPIGWRAAGRRHLFPEPDVLEMAVDRLCRRKPAQRRAAEAERGGEESVRTAGVDDERRGDRDRISVARAVQHEACADVAHRLQTGPVEEDGPCRLCVAREGVIEIGAVPVRVRDLVGRARPDQQLSSMLLVVAERLVWCVEVEGEPALDPGGHVRVRALPRPPLRKRPDPGQIEPVGQFLQEQVRQGRRRLADGESRMAVAFDERHAPAAAAEGERGE